MIINYSIVLSDAQYGWSLGPHNTAFLSAVRDTYGECCNITKLETSQSAWWEELVQIAYLNRYTAVVF